MSTYRGPTLMRPRASGAHVFGRKLAENKTKPNRAQSRAHGAYSMGTRYFGGQGGVTCGVAPETHLYRTFDAVNKVQCTMYYPIIHPCVVDALTGRCRRQKHSFRRTLLLRPAYNVRYLPRANHRILYIRVAQFGRQNPVPSHTAAAKKYTQR